MFTAGWGAFLLAALKALPALIQLAASIKATADAKTNQGIGYQQAVADSLKTASDHLTIARQVEVEADHDHATKTDDTAFDPDFMRKD